MRLNTLIKRVEKLRDGGMVPLVKECCELNGTKRWIVNANKDQLKEGKNTNGVLMGNGAYSRRHYMARIKKGLPVDHVYLSFEGDMQEAMDVDYSDTGFSVKTTDWKQRLVDEVMRTGYWPTSGYNAPEYGPVFGLTAEHKSELVKMIAPRMAKRVRDRLMSGR